MRLTNRLYTILGIFNTKDASVKRISDLVNIPSQKLKYYNEKNVLPSDEDLIKIEKALGITKTQVMLTMGIYNYALLDAISANYKEISHHLKADPTPHCSQTSDPVFSTQFGKLFQADCVDLLNTMEEKSIDLIFADPPFNLSKLYESGINDDLSKEDYLKWCEEWTDGCIKILKDGGSMFIWNIPKWNTYLADYLNRRLTFKNWISVDIKYSLPIQGKLYPSHYSLLYYVKGEKANYFKPDRLPMELCKNCFKEIKDYGGYKDKMNPNGINISDVWYDIPPVRHSKYKNREANELSIKLLDRVIEMASKPGDVVFDPFGGSGTTYVVAEMKERKWIGVEIGSTTDIVNRFKNIDIERHQLKSIRENLNKLFPDAVKERRKQIKLWTDESFAR